MQLLIILDGIEKETNLIDKTNTTLFWQFAIENKSSVSIM